MIRERLDMGKHVEIKTPKSCCACGACMNICPVNAISMKASKGGYLYPDVNEDKCLNCGKCKTVCNFDREKDGQQSVLAVYAAINRDEQVLYESSSGGVFSAIAKKILEEGGVVFGAIWTKEKNVKHVGITDICDLQLLRGSKYVQSETHFSFREVKAFLEKGRKVCYSGTPCQISGLKSFLGKSFDNLLTVDIVCHGVPSHQLLMDDLKHLNSGSVSNFNVRFRDKKYGWGTAGTLSDEKKTIKYNSLNSPYYFYFLRGELYRDSCYACRFPSEGRQGDITLGDFWGIKKEHIKKMNVKSASAGVSCVIINSEKGMAWLKKIKEDMICTSITIDDAKRNNGQLVHCSSPSNEHEQLLDGYLREGYNYIVKMYHKKRLDRMILMFKSLIPSELKYFLKYVFFSR